MPPNQSTLRNQIGFSRRSRSPYQEQHDWHLHEDSEGNIEGVEYIAELSGYTTDEDKGISCRVAQYARRPSVGSASSRSLKQKQKTNDLRHSSQSSSQRSYSYRSKKKSQPNSNPSSSVRLCPSPGKRPSAQFTLSSPETSGRDMSGTDDDIPTLKLPEGYIPHPKPSIGRSPLLNRDVLRLSAESSSAGLEPMIFKLSLSEDSDPGCGRGLRGIAGAGERMGRVGRKGIGQKGRMGDGGEQQQERSTNAT